jgi:hypothetical protein
MCDELALKAMSISGSHTRLARLHRLLVFSLHHHDEEDSAFVPTAKPGHSPIIDTIAKSHRLAKPKELCLNVHGYSRPHTSLGWREQSTPPSANRARRPHYMPITSQLADS